MFSLPKQTALLPLIPSPLASPKTPSSPPLIASIVLHWLTSSLQTHRDHPILKKGKTESGSQLLPPGTPIRRPLSRFQNRSPHIPLHFLFAPFSPCDLAALLAVLKRTSPHGLSSVLPSPALLQHAVMRSATSVVNSSFPSMLLLLTASLTCCPSSSGNPQMLMSLEIQHPSPLLFPLTIASILGLHLL